MIRVLLFPILLFFQHTCLIAQTLTAVKSPDGNNKLEFKIEKGLPFYRIIKEKDELLNWSELGLKLKDQEAYGSFEIINTVKESHTDVWEPLWEKATSIRNEYNGLKTTLREKQAPNRELTIIFRVYDDGVAWRYELPL